MKQFVTALLPVVIIAQLVAAEEPIRKRIERADIRVTDAYHDPASS